MFQPTIPGRHRCTLPGRFWMPPRWIPCPTAAIENCERCGQFCEPWSFLGAMFPGFASKLFSNPSAIVKLSQSRAWPLARGLGELYDVWSRLNSCVASCCIASPFIPKKGDSKWCVVGLPVTHTKWVTPSLRLLMADAEIWGPPTGPPENVTKHVRYPPVN